MILAEMQREPRLLLAVKQAIDRHRRPGQLLLTGSANLLPMSCPSPVARPAGIRRAGSLWDQRRAGTAFQIRW